jgi:hypothetical protein
MREEQLSNVADSMRVNWESLSDEINESESHDEKHSEQRI